MQSEHDMTALGNVDVIYCIYPGFTFYYGDRACSEFDYSRRLNETSSA